MSFQRELLLFLLLCAILKLGGVLLSFISKWAANYQRGCPEPKSHSPPDDDAEVATESAGVKCLR